MGPGLNKTKRRGEVKKVCVTDPFHTLLPQVLRG